MTCHNADIQKLQILSEPELCGNRFVSNTLPCLRVSLSARKACRKLRTLTQLFLLRVELSSYESKTLQSQPGSLVHKTLSSNGRIQSLYQCEVF